MVRNGRREEEPKGGEGGVPIAPEEVGAGGVGVVIRNWRGRRGRGGGGGGGRAMVGVTGWFRGRRKLEELAGFFFRGREAVEDGKGAIGASAVNDEGVALERGVELVVSIERNELGTNNRDEEGAVRGKPSAKEFRGKIVRQR